MSHYAQIIFFAAVMLWSYTNADECIEANESQDLCASMCAPTCKNPHPNPIFCPRIVCTSFTAGCRCNDGYVRNTDDNSCVHLEDCPPPPQ